MRKLPLVKYLKKQVSAQLDCDGIFDDHTKHIGISKGLEWDNEMDTLIHEYIHFLLDKYPTKTKKLNDVADLKKNETDRMARRICRLLVKPQYQRRFK